MEICGTSIRYLPLTICGAQRKAFSRRVSVRVLPTTKVVRVPRHKPEGAERREAQFHLIRAHRQTLPLADASGAAARTFGARLPSGAPLAALARTFTSRLSSRPGFLGLGSRGRYPPSPVPVQGKHLPPRP